MQHKRFSRITAGRLAGFFLVAALVGTAHAQYYGGTYTGNKKDAPIDVSSYPANIQRAYKTFKSTCSECHTLNRSFGETDTPDTAKHWVNLMQDKPAADFNDRQAEQIIEFLNYYHAHPPKDSW